MQSVIISVKVSNYNSNIATFAHSNSDAVSAAKFASDNPTNDATLKFSIFATNCCSDKYAL
jgi:hypothetical protein